jgi:hypothetical protein
LYSCRWSPFDLQLGCASLIGCSSALGSVVILPFNHPSVFDPLAFWLSCLLAFDPLELGYDAAFLLVPWEKHYFFGLMPSKGSGGTGKSLFL